MLVRTKNVTSLKNLTQHSECGVDKNCQFHQHLKAAVSTNFFLPKKHKPKMVSHKSLKLLYEKAPGNMLVKLTPRNKTTTVCVKDCGFYKPTLTNTNVRRQSENCVLAELKHAPANACPGFRP
jgi:hypothetical protein